MIGSPVTAGASLMPPDGTPNANSLSSNTDGELIPSNGMINHASASKASTSTLSRPSKTAHQRKLSMPSQFPPAGRGSTLASSFLIEGLTYLLSCSGSDSRNSQLTEMLKQSFTPKRGTVSVLTDHTNKLPCKLNF